MKRRLFAAAGLLVAAALLQPARAAVTQVIKVGVRAGPHAQIMDEVRRVAATRGLTLEVIVFDKPATIDAALAAKQIDAASFEDEPSFDAQRQQHGYALD